MSKNDSTQAMSIQNMFMPGCHHEIEPSDVDYPFWVELYDIITAPNMDLESVVGHTIVGTCLIDYFKGP